MVTKFVTNTSDRALGLPDGPVIPARTANVKVDDWEKKESNLVVKAWIDAKALVIGDSASKANEAKVAATSGDNGGGPAPAATPAGATSGKTEAELRDMTNADLASYIEKDLKGEVKSGSNKDDLVKQALELQAKHA